MLWDLGLDAVKMEQFSAVKQKITKLEEEFDFGKIFMSLNIIFKLFL